MSPEVAARLEETERFGLWWFNRYRAVTNYGRNSSRTFIEKPMEEWVAVPVLDCGVPREWVDAARSALRDNYRPKNKSYRYWELTGGILYCGECGRRMIGHSMTTNRRGKRQYFYYVCPKKSLEHNRACGNKNHRAAPLEQRIAEAITDLLCDPARLERQIDQKIERERQVIIAPEKEIAVLKERLERLAFTRRNYQTQQAAGLMTLDELGQRLSELDEGREGIRRELATVQDRNERIAELENIRTIVLALYAGFISAGLNVLPPEERRRVYCALGLRVTLSADGNVEINGNLENDVFPPEKEADDLVSGIVHDPERRARREALRAAVGKRLAEHRRGVMSAETTPRCRFQDTEQPELRFRDWINGNDAERVEIVRA